MAPKGAKVAAAAAAVEEVSRIDVSVKLLVVQWSLLISFVDKGLVVVVVVVVVMKWGEGKKVWRVGDKVIE